MEKLLDPFEVLIRKYKDGYIDKKTFEHTVCLGTKNKKYIPRHFLESQCADNDWNFIVPILEHLVSNMNMYLVQGHNTKYVSVDLYVPRFDTVIGPIIIEKEISHVIDSLKTCSEKIKMREDGKSVKIPLYSSEQTRQYISLILSIQDKTLTGGKCVHVRTHVKL